MWVAVGFVTLAGCGASGLSLDAGGADTTSAEAGEEVACSADASVRDGGIEAAAGEVGPGGVSQWCAGEIEVSGVTPAGPFAPTMVSAKVGFGDCSTHLSFTLADGQGPTAQALFFSIPRDPATKTWHGTHQTTGSLVFQGKMSRVEMTVEVISATDPFAALDGGFPNSGVGPTGEVSIRLTFTTACGVVMGSFVASYCSWVFCI
jgi:hypothetical protein